MMKTAVNKQKKRGRIFPEIQWTDEQLTQYKAEKDLFYQRCRTLFKKLYPNLITDHYNHYIAIEPNSEDYFIDADLEKASEKAHQKYPHADHCVFCLNENGTTGKI